MAVYRGPREKFERRFGEAIFGIGKSLKRRNYAPGQHGKKKRNKSVYAQQLFEKQKVRYTYGLMENQFFRLFQEASNSKGITGEILIKFLEARLDNVVYRFGLAPTRRAARQLVSHGHIIVNGRKVDIPSYRINVEDLISLRDRSKPIIKNVPSKSLYEWLDWDNKNLIGKIISIPERNQIPENINEQKIVDFYSR